MNGRFLQPGPRSSFTLVEMLVVLAIVAIIAGISLTAFTGVNNAMNLSSATQAVMNDLTIDRQTALTMDESVQVRFYSYRDTSGVTTSNEFQAFQAFSIKNSVTNALERVNYLPPMIMISSKSAYSSPLATNTAYTPLATDPSIYANNVGHSYTYSTVVFKCDGTIDPAVSSWFITLHEKRFLSTTPVNFTTVNIDPSNGRIRYFQP